MQPFQQVKLYHGNQGNVANAHSDAERRKARNGSAEMGSWKGVMRMLEPNVHKSDQETSDFIKDLLDPKALVCRVYVTQGHNFAALDNDRKSDPYLVIKCGKHKVSTRDHYQKKTLDPKFYECFEFPVMLPGDAVVRVEAWDYDGIGDDYIGCTNIDIEDRYFSTNWRVMEPKPLERRKLYNFTSSAQQGVLDCWVEVMTPSQAKATPQLNITPPPDEEFELRVVIWTVHDCPAYDELTNQSDLYVTGFLDTDHGKKSKQSTDIHFRTKTGIGNWNWRMKWPVYLPGPRMPRLRLQLWDKDITAPDDTIAEVTLPLARLCKRALVSPGKSVFYTSDGERDFWLHKLKTPTATKESKKGLPKMKIRVELLPKAVAQEKLAGIGRSEPNMHPFLPPPEGRITLSLNPIKMCYEMLGPDMFKNALIAFCIGLLISALAYFLPMLLASSLAQ